MNYGVIASLAALIAALAGLYAAFGPLSNKSDTFLAEGSCFSSDDCDRDIQYCSGGVCVDNGSCNVDADCFNPDNFWPVIECIGPISCDEEGLCGRTCTGFFCPDEQNYVNCFASPCEVLSDSCSDEVANCADNYCGGCNVYAFDAAGNQVCTSTDPVPEMESGSCTSSSDCDEGEYCAGGVCLAGGSCNVDLDCRNPANEYVIAECIGVIGCEQGVCGIECSGTFCADGSPIVSCLTDPCSTLPSCEEEWVHCIADYCNEACDVILFDAAGNEVKCTPL